MYGEAIIPINQTVLVFSLCKDGARLLPSRAKVPSPPRFMPGCPTRTFCSLLGLGSGEDD